MALTLNRERQKLGAKVCGNASRFLLGRAVSGDLFAVETHICDPASIAGDPANPAMLRSAGISRWDILALLGGGHDAQVRAAVVEPIAVDVVPLAGVSVDESEDFPVHSEGTLAATGYVDRPYRVAIVEAPPPSREGIQISGIDDGPCADASIAGAQRNPRASHALQSTAGVG